MDDKANKSSHICLWGPSLPEQYRVTVSCTKPSNDLFLLCLIKKKQLTSLHCFDGGDIRAKPCHEQLCPFQPCWHGVSGRPQESLEARHCLLWWCVMWRLTFSHKLQRGLASTLLHFIQQLAAPVPAYTNCRLQANHSTLAMKLRENCVFFDCPAKGGYVHTK